MFRVGVALMSLPVVHRSVWFVKRLLCELGVCEHGPTLLMQIYHRGTPVS